MHNNTRELDKGTPHNNTQVNEVSAISELQSQMANLSVLLSQVVEGFKSARNKCLWCVLYARTSN